MPGNIVALDIHLPKPEDARHNVLWEGQLCPVTRMFGFDGQHVHDPLHAFSCVACLVFPNGGDNGQWVAMEVKPGEIGIMPGATEPVRKWRDL